MAQLTLSANRHVLRGQERGPNLFEAIDAVTDVMDRQIRRYKGKVYRTEQARKAGKAAPGPAQELVEAEADGLQHTQVVRTKRLPFKPMTVEDAIVEMELVGHSFFLFNNIDTGEYNVVYGRRDGDYGVIESELA